MRALSFAFLVLVALNAFGQKPDDVIATATGKQWRVKDLSPDALDALAKFPAYLSSVRTNLLATTLGETLIELEAKSRNIKPEALLKLQTKAIKEPTAAAIKAVYDANSDRLGGKPLAEVRSEIIQFLRREPEEKVINAYVDTLATKYRVTYPKSVNAVGLRSTDVLISYTGGTYTAKQFEDENRLTLYNVTADFFENLRAAAEDTVFNALVVDEAKALKLDSGALLAQEITAKMKDYTDDERTTLTNDLRTKLFTKYKANITLSEPEAPVQNISTDDDPAVGPATAPITIVMFSDFQCSACAATHPLLKEAIQPYAEKVRLVVRDFPLEAIHPNAFNAARAANAASSQGKFFEFAEMLYMNQKAQDDASLKKYAVVLGLNAQRFALDFTSEKTAAEVRKDIADGRSYGVTATPTIFVNGRYVRTLSVDGFRKAIEAALSK